MPPTIPLFRLLSPRAVRGVHTVSTPPVIVISGPSGAGKSTLLKRLFTAHPNTFGFSVSHTTRPPRPTERPGIDYHFTTAPHFHTLKSQNAFIEHATFAAHSYGTSRSAIQSVLDSGRVCVLDIELEGVKQVKQTEIEARFVFVAPPSLAELERRLRARGTEGEEAVRRRLESAGREMEWAEKGGHDKVVVNDEVERAYEELEGWIMGVLGRGRIGEEKL
ncbi:guanylate kinase [Ascodesmis nigricans]|uniref:Guanylate kinase n=1 Tax=Ascodesmis nigricans TaxID=341454 RepID=A0A4S2N8R1_9PEZI|nr:guanylate kinase [Ascodesmis nigricans]